MRLFCGISISCGKARFLSFFYFIIWNLFAVGRANDVMLILLISYTLAMSFIPRLSDTTMLRVHFVHALGWCLVHYVGLGFLLNAQSKNKYIVRHFMKHYHYTAGDDGNGAVMEAFTNWKTIYNLSMCMTYGQFVCCILGATRLILI